MARPANLTCHLTCHMAMHALPAFFEERATSETGLAERLKGVVGLNMNYSIIFTEISFYPETSILLQIIQIIHMTIWIMPQFDREVWTVCLFWLQGGKHKQPPTDKKSRLSGLPRGTFRPPPPFLKGRKERLTSYPKQLANSMKEYSKTLT